MKNWKYAHIFTAFALFFASSLANMHCPSNFGQDEEPATLKALRKF